MKFSNQLKKLRCEANLPQRIVAEELNIAIRSYQRYEEGSREPNIDTLIALADYFSVSLDFLLGRKNENGTKLFAFPDGKIDYNIHNSKEKTDSGTFSYSFGAFLFNDLLFKFLYIQDVQGELISKIQNNSLEFLAFVSLVNEALKLGYSISNQKNGLHKVDFIVKSDDKIHMPQPYYKKVYINLNGKIAVEDISWGGYESFIMQYLTWSTQEKINFLEKNIPL